MGRGRKRHRRIETAPTQKTAPAPEPFVPQYGEIVPELVAVDPEDVQDIWPLAISLLAPEMPNTDWTEEQLMAACVYGHAKLWMICDQHDTARAALVTMLSPRQRCIVAVCCGDNLWDYLNARHQLYAWAKDQGMKEVTFYGRPALAKLMPECKRAGVILRKEL